MPRQRLLVLAEAGVRSGAGDDGGWGAAGVGRGGGTVLGGLGYGTEFVLHHLDGGAGAGGAHDAAGNHQLEGGRVVQEHRPGDGEFDIEADGQGAAGIEEDAGAREIDAGAGSTVEKAPAADQFPAQLQLQIVAAIDAAITSDSFNCFELFVPAVDRSHAV